MRTNPPAAITTDSLLDERFITDAELAPLIGWSKSSLASMRCKGRLPFAHYRIGSSVRYRESDIAAYLNAARVAPKTGTPAA